MKDLNPGDRISYLTLKEKVYVKGNGSKGKYSWICQCCCGQEVIRRQDLFEPDKSMSCGCQHPSKHRKGSNSPIWKGAGELGAQFFGMIRKGADYRGIKFDITIEFAWELFQKQGGKCALTGWPITLVSFRDRKRGIEQTASLDRIDSGPNGGYTVDNVWWTHKDVNMMKKEYTLSRYVEVCKAVADHAREQEQRLAA